MANVKLASFPNSRIRPRAATRVADTRQVSVPSGNPNFILVPANPNRTYVSIYNESSTDPIFYGYSPIVIPSESFRVPAGGTVSNIESPQDIYCFQSSGGPIVVSVDEGEG